MSKEKYLVNNMSSSGYLKGGENDSKEVIQSTGNSGSLWCFITKRPSCSKANTQMEENSSILFVFTYSDLLLKSLYNFINIFPNFLLLYFSSNDLPVRRLILIQPEVAGFSGQKTRLQNYI